MKRIRTIIGIRTISDSEEEAILLKTKEILDEIRAALIARINSGLSTYIDYRFKTRINGKQSESIKNALHVVQNSSVEMKHYENVVQEVLLHDDIYIGTSLFYEEIDEHIGWYLQKPEMKVAM